MRILHAGTSLQAAHATETTLRDGEERAIRLAQQLRFQKLAAYIARYFVDAGRTARATCERDKKIRAETATAQHVVISSSHPNASAIQPAAGQLAAEKDTCRHDLRLGHNIRPYKVEIAASPFSAEPCTANAAQARLGDRRRATVSTRRPQTPAHR